MVPYFTALNKRFYPFVSVPASAEEELEVSEPAGV